MIATTTKHEGGGQVERVVLPSALRRGRMATSPVWRVEDPARVLWQFQTRKAAAAFATNGCPEHEARMSCRRCGGLNVTPRAWMPDNCPIAERTADGVPVGRCFHHVKNGHCPRHGDVSAAVEKHKATGKLTDERDLDAARGADAQPLGYMQGRGAS